MSAESRYRSHTSPAARGRNASAARISDARTTDSGPPPLSLPSPIPSPSRRESTEAEAVSVAGDEVGGELGLVRGGEPGELPQGGAEPDAAEVPPELRHLHPLLSSPGPPPWKMEDILREGIRVDSAVVAREAPAAPDRVQKLHQIKRLPHHRSVER